MKKIIVIMCCLVFGWCLSANAKDKYIQGYLTMYPDGSIDIPENPCPSKKGKKWEMIEIKNGKAYKNPRIDCNRSNKQYRVRLKKTDGSEEETYVVFPSVWIGDNIQPSVFQEGKQTPLMGFETGVVEENSIVIKIPYSEDLEELVFESVEEVEEEEEEEEEVEEEVEEVEEEGIEPSFLSGPLLTLRVADIKDASTNGAFQGSPNDGVLSIVFLGSGYPNTTAGMATYTSDCQVTANYWRAQQPLKKYSANVMFYGSTQLSDNIQDYGCWENSVCNALCVQCHAGRLCANPDEIMVLENMDNTAVGGRAYIDCPEFSPPHPQNSENTYGWAFMGEWAGDFYAAAKGAWHEYGHSGFGLMDEYTVEYGGAPYGALPVCNSGYSNCSPGCGITGYSWVPEDGCAKCNNCWFGCYWDSWVRCSATCAMLNFNNSKLCYRCLALAKKKVLWELEGG